MDKRPTALPDTILSLLGFFVVFLKAIRHHPYRTSTAIAYLILHFFVGISITYCCLTGFFNKTVLEVRDNVLDVKDTPLTFFRKSIINLDALDQLYSKGKRHRGKALSWPSSEVHAILKPGEGIRLVSGLKKSEQALYIEHVQDDHLGIKDRLVDGEIPRS